MLRALEGLAGAGNAQVDRATKKAVVVFDGEKVKVEQLLEAVVKAGYKPRRDSAVLATAEAAGVKVEAASKDPSLKTGKDGSVNVKLTLPDGAKISGLVVEASGDGALKPSQAKVEGKDGEKEIAVPMTVEKGAKAGQLHTTLTIRWKHAAGKGDPQQQEIKLKVPVYVE